jgi:hypothetical protein
MHDFAIFIPLCYYSRVTVQRKTFTRMQNSPSENRPARHRASLGTLLPGLGLALFVLASCIPSTPPAAELTATAPVIASPTCPVVSSLSTPDVVIPPTKLVVMLYDPRVQVDSALELTSGERLTDVQQFAQRLLPDLLGPGDQLSVFQLGYGSYTDSRVTRQYSFLTSYPQLYVAPSLETLTPLPPTGIPTPGFEAVATSNEFRVQSTARALEQAAQEARFKCDLAYYDLNVKSTATAWHEAKVSDAGALSTAMAADFSKVKPSTSENNELKHGGLYFALTYATSDIQADCAKYDECDLIIVDDLAHFGRIIPPGVAVDLQGVNLFVIMPNCRDLNQPDCAELQAYWTPQFKTFGARKITFWNGLRAELNLLGALGG